MSHAAPTQTLPQLLRHLTADPGRPRLTWYGPGGERIELSGHVLDNWVSKTTNLLVEEYDVGPGSRVRLDLPPHWRAVVWALAVWRAGGCVVILEDDAPTTADLVVTHRPAGPAVPPGVDVVAVALPALARRFDGELPAGAVDAAAAVMTYGDQLGWVPPADDAADALEQATGTVTHGGLLTWAAAGATRAAPSSPSADDERDQPAPRVLLEPLPGPHGLAAVLACTLRTYAVDGSVVLSSPEMAAELAADPSRRSRIASDERVTDS
ncbi:TIGR03089 family protein [Actinotalea sp. K2]|uniref:TIGR03089 family protein n=1 Tax=Actinotalea sp. K2 TaxID=2939438 RepID=UPI0020180CC0|nr:TIGR03089 family protein [Actinotalea sp. K2]MCL3862692.1 TIGR03089 family protein [Actinotalea sp. K2]